MNAIEDVLAALLEPEERIEGQLKVRGVARYAADASRPGTLWSATLYSSVAHARIVSLDVSAARAMPGVHAVLTGQDLGSTLWGRRIRDWPLLATDTVDMIVRDLGLDPIEFRLMNVTHAGDTDVTGAAVHVPQGGAVLERLRQELNGVGSPIAGRGRGIGLGTRHVGD